jgi:hypothetical protein
VQLGAPVLGQAVVPAAARARAQAALHDSAALRDHPATYYQACGDDHYEGKRDLGEREN